MNSVLDIANYIIGNYDAKKHQITPMKLQKLVYYTHVWSLVANAPLIKSSQFTKWKHGPVNEALYQAYKSFGSQPIENAPTKQHKTLTGQEKALADFIIHSYLPFNAITLSKTTHTEAPWIKTAVNEIISDEFILAYYSTQSYAKNFTEGLEKIPSLVPQKPFFAPKTTAFQSFVFDVSPSDTSIHDNSYPSFDAYVRSFEQQKFYLASIFKMH